MPVNVLITIMMLAYITIEHMLCTIMNEIMINLNLKATKRVILIT